MDNHTAISLTPSAAERVRLHLGAGAGLRLGVRRSGCSGWAYTVAPADDADAKDAVFEDRGVRIIVEKQHLPLLAGTRIDYVREGLNERFQFQNPNAGESCGCGESFTGPA